MKRLEPNLSTRGRRLAYARRVLGAVIGEDLSREAAAKRASTTGQTWGRWEDDEDRWRDSTLQKLVELFRSAGLEWVTPAWLDHGYGEIPVILSPPSAHHETRPAIRGERLEKSGDKKRQGGTGRGGR